MNALEPPRPRPTPAPGRQELKKQATHAAVVEAAVRLVAEHGVDKVTVDKIAAKANIVQRTFFNHFPTKEQALVAATGDSSADFNAAFRARPPGESVLQALRGALFEVFDRTKAMDPVRAKALRAIRTSPALMPYQLALLAKQEHDLADAIRERVTGGGRVEIDPLYPEVCAAAAGAALRVVLNRWLTTWVGPDTPPLSRLLREFNQALSLLAEGLDHPSNLPDRPDRDDADPGRDKES